MGGGFPLTRDQLSMQVSLKGRSVAILFVKYSR